MREVTYTYLHPTGGELENQKDQLAEFLQWLPHLFYFGYMPSLSVLNTFLAVGLDDAGMGGGCRWEPFQVSPSEYEELDTYLRASSGRRPHKFVAVPEHVQTKNQWFAWVWNVDCGQPYEESLEHLERMDRLADRRDLARTQGDADLAESLHWEWFRAAEKFHQFTEPYIRGRGERGR